MIVQSTCIWQVCFLLGITYIQEIKRELVFHPNVKHPHKAILATIDTVSICL